MNNWQKLCSIMTQPYTDEKSVVNVFVDFLHQTLGWPTSDIYREIPVQVGHETKFADVMFADSSLIVEAKRQGVNLHDVHILRQLYSYMRVRYKKFGLLLGDELWLFYDDYADKCEDLKVIVQFNFAEPNDEIAGRLFDILSRENFDVTKLEDFCHQHWAGKFMLDLATGAHSVHKRRMTTTAVRPGLPNSFWLDFRTQYQEQDQDGILALMQLGRHHDIFADAATIKQHFRQKYGFQFGLAKGNRPGMCKVEVRLTQKPAYAEYFAAHLPEIVRCIAEIGGTYYTSSPETVINCFFPINLPSESEDYSEAYARIFIMYQAFRDIILNYYLRRI